VGVEEGDVEFAVSFMFSLLMLLLREGGGGEEEEKEEIIPSSSVSIGCVGDFSLVSVCLVVVVTKRWC
jgi:hypothetical protein